MSVDQAATVNIEFAINVSCDYEAVSGIKLSHYHGACIDLAGFTGGI